MTMMRSRWAAIGAAVAVTLGAGGIGLVRATSPADAVTFVPITPCRVVDTRPDFQVGPKSTPLGPGETHTVAAADGACDGKIPAGATALSLNVTTLDATLLTFLTIWKTGDTRPNASSLNPAPGQPPTPNAVTTGIDADGEFDIYNLQGTVHVLADINGYYVDHIHDDRYYTKAQSDGRYYTKAQADEAFASADDVALTKFLSINVYADPALNFDERYADLADDGLGGLNLDIDFNFTVPPDYTPGGAIEFHVLAYARDSTAFPCNGELSSNWIGVSREGEPKLALGAGGPNSDLQPPEILKVFTTPDIVERYVFYPGPDAALQPGDGVGFGLSNFGPATRCELVVSSVSVLYE